jgi:hypothetical protein
VSDDGVGPYLQMAVICEKVIEDKTDSLSLIRIIDNVTQTATGPEPPEQMPPIVLSNLMLVIALKAGKARGRYAVKVVVEDPSGSQLPSPEIPIQLEGEFRGVNLITPLNVAAQYEGIYWFDIYFVAGRDKESLLTRIPLQVHYQPQRIPPS